MRSPLPVLVLSLLAALFASACQAAIIRAPGVLEPDEEPDEIDNPALYFAENVEPILTEMCASCHEDAASSAGSVFLDPGGNYYDSVRAYPDLIEPGNGADSLLVTKVTIDTHRGGMVSANDATIFRTWIDAEGEGTPPPPPPPVDDPVVTGFYPIDEGQNRIPLMEVGLPGCELVFTAMRINAGANMLLTDVVLEAGAGGLSVSHPRFLIQDDTSEMMWEDRDTFSDVTLRVEESMSGTLASTHVLAAFPTMGSLAVQFESASVPSTM